MPTYEYECTKCGHTFEKRQGMTDEPLKRCPECRGKIERVIHGGAALMFKGSGFHVTDSRKPAAPCGRQTACEGGSCPMAQ